MPAECTLLDWAARPRPLDRIVLAARDGVLVDAAPAAAGDTRPRCTPYAVGALCGLRGAGYAIVMLATADGTAPRDLAPPATAAALELLDPDRDLIDYAVVCTHPPGDGAPCIRALECKAGSTVGKGWVVGDHRGDLARGRALGLRTALVATGDGVATWDGLDADQRATVDVRASRFAEAVRQMLLACQATGA